MGKSQKASGFLYGNHGNAIFALRQIQKRDMVYLDFLA
jgi:hypothetical protein